MERADFADFYAAEFTGVARAIAVAAGSADLGDEIAQEAFARALRKWPTVRASDRPVAWVYTVAINLLRDRWRRSRTVEQYVAPVTTADDGTAAVATRLAIRAALAALPRRQREAVVLYHLADLSIDEVAQAMKCAPGTVKSTLHAALKSLRVEMEEPDDDLC